MVRLEADMANEAAAQSDRQARELEARRLKSGATVDKPAVAPIVQAPLPPGHKYKYCAVCRKVGHGGHYSEVLLKRPDWRLRPSVKWFEDDMHNQYYCPAGNTLVDFSDELHFSRLAMYLKGRQCLENKAKLSLLVPHLLPETWYIHDMQWLDGHFPVDKKGDVFPWFVKEAEGNEGTFVECCLHASECMGFAKPGKNCVVQQHVDHLLYEGRKFHLRVYVLIICMEDGKTWNAYTYKDGYLNISPNQWVPGDISRDTQVVIYRSQRIGDWKPWGDVYPKCKASVVETVQQAVAQDQLQGRPGQKQFELASWDYMVDKHGNAILIEINMGPVLRDSHLDPECHDEDMITSAFEIIVPREDHPNIGEWDFAGEFIGKELVRAPDPGYAASIPADATKVIEDIEPITDDVVNDLAAFLDDLS